MIDILLVAEPGVTQGVSIAIGIIGLAAIVFAALRFRAENTKVLTATATELVTGMSTVTEEIRKQRDEAMAREATIRDREERLIEENRQLCEEVSALRQEVKGLRAAIEALERKRW